MPLHQVFIIDVIWMSCWIHTRWASIYSELWKCEASRQIELVLRLVLENPIAFRRVDYHIYSSVKKTLP